MNALPRTLLHLVLSAMLAGTASQAGTQLPGMLDPLFNKSGGVSDEVTAVVRQPNGRILIGGLFTAVGGQTRNRIARLLPSGRLDPSFNPGSGFTAEITAIAVQRDGRILVAGAAGNSYNGVSISRLVRLLPDGRIDPSFNPGTGPDNTVNAILPLPDGNIIIVGSFQNVSGTGRNRIARLTPEGVNDGSFIPGTGASGEIRAVTRARNGDLFIAGNFTQFNGFTRTRVAKLRPNGVLDGDFIPDPTLFTSTATSLLLRRNGNLLVGGSRLASLDATTGSTTAGFAGSPASLANINVIAETGNGLWIAGSFLNYAGITNASGLVRLTGNGTIDPAYNLERIPSGAVNAMALLPDGGCILGGIFSTVGGQPSAFLARVNRSGVLIRSFNPPAGVDSTIFAVAAHTNGAMLAGGFFTKIGGRDRPNFARLLPDGRVDTAFHRHGDFNARVFAILPLADGRILVGGNFTSYGGTPVGRIARLLPDGRLDPTFNHGSGFNDSVFTLVLDAEGRILVGGDFTGFGVATRNHLARLSQDGLLDATFDPGVGPNHAVNTIAVQEDGRILIGGKFTNYQGNPRNYIARVLSGGGSDGSFNSVPGPNDEVNCIRVSAFDGSILVGGFFSQYHGSSRRALVRLDPADGSVDASFNPNFSVGAIVNDLASDFDFSLGFCVGGFFSGFGTFSRNNIAYLDGNGNVGPFFNPGTGFDAEVSSLAILPSGKLLVSGAFQAYDGAVTSRIARIHLTPDYQPAIFEGISVLLNAVPGRLTGGLRLAVARGGVASGFINNGRERIRFRCQFDPGARSEFEARMRDGTLLRFNTNLVRGSNGGNPVFQGVVQNFAGTDAALIQSQEAHFSARGRPANHYAGRYPVALWPGGGPIQALVPVSGSSHFICQIANNGRARMAGRAADGRRFSAAAALFHQGSVPVFFPMDRGRSHIAGFINVNASNLTPVLKPVAGTLLWRRDADAVYPAGFVNPVVAEGSAYVPPDRVAPAFGTINPTSVQISIGGGHLVAAPLANVQASFAPNGRAVVIGAGLPGLSLRVNRAAGTFSGQFEPVGAEGRAPIFGVISNGTWGYGSALVRIGGQTRPSWVTLQLVDP